MPEAKITSKGQVTVPKSVREALELKTGDRVNFVVLDDGRVMMHRRNRDIRDLAEILHRPGQRPVTLEEMQGAIEEGAALSVRNAAPAPRRTRGRRAAGHESTTK